MNETTGKNGQRETNGHPAALIVGCGYVGMRLARQLSEQGRTVYGTTRHDARFSELQAAGVQPLLMDVMQPLTFASLRRPFDEPTLDVFCLIPPGRPGGDPSPPEIVVSGGGNLIAALIPLQAKIRRVVVASSTGVYSEAAGTIVDADTDPRPDSSRAKLLREGERLWLNSDLPARVVRFAGLYGPGRVIGLKGLAQGAPIAGDPNAMLNLIHGDDAASLMIAVAERDSAGEIELGSDGHPVRRLDFYSEVARRAGLPAPRLMTEAEAQAMGIGGSRQRATSKRCDPTMTMKRTGWSPKFPSYLAGLSEPNIARELAASQMG